MHVTTVNCTSDQSTTIVCASKRCQSTTTVCVKRITEYHYSVCQKDTRVLLQCVSKGYLRTTTVCVSKGYQSTTTVCVKSVPWVPLQCVLKVHLNTTTVCVKRIPVYYFSVCQKGTWIPLQCVKRIPEYYFSVCQKGTCVPLQCVSKVYPEYHYSVCHTSILHKDVNPSRSHHHAVQSHDVVVMKTGSYLHLQGGELVLPHLQPTHITLTNEILYFTWFNPCIVYCYITGQ